MKRHPERRRLLSSWWGSGDSNPDAFRHQILNLARLPIPALPQGIQHDPKSCSSASSDTPPSNIEDDRYQSSRY